MLLLEHTFSDAQKHNAQVIEHNVSTNPRAIVVLILGKTSCMEYLNCVKLT